MNLLLILIVCIVAVSIVTIAIIRKYLKVKSFKLSNHIKDLTPYCNKTIYEQAKEDLPALDNRVFIDIPTDINNSFYCKIISSTQENAFSNYYRPHFQEAYSLLKKLKTFNITPSKTISKFINDFGTINNLVKQHNDVVVTFLLDTHKEIGRAHV